MRGRRRTRGQVRVASFDIFDTLLLRLVGSPPSAFLLVGRVPEAAEITGLTPGGFAASRVLAERLARRDRPEVTTRQVYDELLEGIAGDPDAADRLIELEIEIEVERRLAVARPLAGALLGGPPRLPALGPARRPPARPPSTRVPGTGRGAAPKHRWPDPRPLRRYPGGRRRPNSSIACDSGTRSRR